MPSLTRRMQDSNKLRDSSLRYASFRMTVRKSYNNLKRRTYKHKNGLVEGFSKKYKLKNIVYFEAYKGIEEAIIREKKLKNWRRT
ncbi:GIY-YIG nuclease family protein [Candidatus Roizmanbacteria bacterium]|nr:GIY-YIG nuclease family protein [Candidatus Roizmanbacteria bacterium]